MKEKLLNVVRGRRGISMVEMVVALAIVMLVSAATVTLLVTTSVSEAKTAAAMAAADLGESAVECFRYAEDEDDFYAALRLLDPGFVKEADAAGYVLDVGSCRAAITVDFSADVDRLEFCAVDADGGEVCRLSYEK